MNTTKILGEAVGIQRQDIIDRTEEQTADGLTGAVILGRFKRWMHQSKFIRVNLVNLGMIQRTQTTLLFKIVWIQVCPVCKCCVLTIINVM